MHIKMRSFGKNLCEKKIIFLMKNEWMLTETIIYWIEYFIKIISFKFVCINYKVIIILIYNYNKIYNWQDTGFRPITF